MQRTKRQYVLMMAGGEGTRFTPLSTPAKPKQFLNLLDPTQTLLQQTYDLLRPLFPVENILVATNHRYLSLVKEQLPDLPDSQIFGETHKKNTGPCLAWVSHHLYRQDPKSIVMAIPSDQFITPVSLFHETVRNAFEMAEKENAIVTIGIRPTFPSTHHGYLHKNGNKVEEFIEKPDGATAERFFKNGNYYWNGGTFIFPVAKMLKRIQQCLPEMFLLLQTEKTLESFFAKAPSISIDYGVMEKTKNLLMIEAPFTWSDVGTWESLGKLAKQYSLKLSPEVLNLLPQK